MYQPCSSSPPTPSGSFSPWRGPAPYPSSEIEKLWTRSLDMESFSGFHMRRMDRPEIDRRRMWWGRRGLKGGLLPTKKNASQPKRLTRICLLQSGRRDLNPRPPEPHSGALPDCATSRYPTRNPPPREQPAGARRTDAQLVFSDE